MAGFDKLRIAEILIKKGWKVNNYNELIAPLDFFDNFTYNIYEAQALEEIVHNTDFDK